MYMEMCSLNVFCIFELKTCKLVRDPRSEICEPERVTAAAHSLAVSVRVSTGHPVIARSTDIHG